VDSWYQIQNLLKAKSWDIFLNTESTIWKI
jgi:hypothetical protein